MNAYCDDHTNCKTQLKRLEADAIHQWKKLDAMSVKLNLILGGIIISPFLVSVLLFLAKGNS